MQMTNEPPNPNDERMTKDESPTSERKPGEIRNWSRRAFFITVLVTAVVTFGIAALLINIFQHKQEAKNPYVRFVDVNEITTNPEHWGKNWPRQYDGYLRTADITSTKYGGAEGSEGAPPPSRLEMDPWLKRMFAGYAFRSEERRVGKGGRARGGQWTCS